MRTKRRRVGRSKGRIVAMVLGLKWSRLVGAVGREIGRGRQLSRVGSSCLDCLRGRAAGADEIIGIKRVLIMVMKKRAELQVVNWLHLSSSSWWESRWFHAFRTIDSKYSLIFSRESFWNHWKVKRRLSKKFLFGSERNISLVTRVVIPSWNTLKTIWIKWTSKYSKRWELGSFLTALFLWWSLSFSGSFGGTLRHKKPRSVW